MLKLLKRKKRPAVEFCERRASVCDADCRRAALVERGRETMRWHGGRVV